MRAWHAITVAILAISGCGGANGAIGLHRSQGWQATQAADPIPTGGMRRVVSLGHSVRGRPITAVELGSPASPRHVLVVGAIHGDETAGMAVVRDLEGEPAVAGADVWLVADLNPDGVAADSRQNAHRVDLNRNFPFHWQAIGFPGDQQYPGPHPLSEPEARIAHALILRLRPRITIWFHQPLAVVDASGGDIAIERRFARLVKLPLRRLTRYPGSATGWQDHRLPTTTAFVVELPRGTLSHTRVERTAAAIHTIARKSGPSALSGRVARRRSSLAKLRRRLTAVTRHIQYAYTNGAAGDKWTHP